MEPDRVRTKSLESLDRMLAGYREGAKSPHWQMFYTDDMIALLRTNAIKTFRANSLKDDLQDFASWFRTANAYGWLSKIAGTDWIDRFSENKVGEPEVHAINGRRINFHDLVLCEYLWKIDRTVCGRRSDGQTVRRSDGQTVRENEPKLIVEIGGGYGGLAHKLKTRFPGASYVSFDLPEALTLQAFYLSQLNPQASFYLFSDFAAGRPIEPDQYDFLLLPDWLADRLSPHSVDLVINTRSMMEMNRETIAKYFRELQKFLKPGGLFYNVNRYSKDTVGEPIRFREYPYDAKWSVEFSRPAFFQPHVHEMMTRRQVQSYPIARETLKALPERDPTQTRPRIGMFRKMSLLPLALRSFRLRNT